MLAVQLMSQHFASERDTWLVGLGLSAAVLSVVALVPLLMANVDGFVKVVTAALLILTVVLVSWVYLGTYYVVEAEELIVQSGPFCWRILIEEIHQISPTRAPWSSPALSLNRLRIDYGVGKWILLSPECREEFIHSLGVPVT